MRRVLQVTLILVIPSFVLFYGWGSGTKGQGGAGEQITFASVKSPSGLKRMDLTTQHMIRAKNSLMGDLSRQLGRVDRYELEQGVSNRDIAQKAVNLVALERLVRSEHLSVPRQELAHLVSQMLPGMTGEQIRRAVEAQGINYRQWLADLEESHKLAKAEMLIESAAHVTLAELWQDFLARKMKIEAEYVEFPAQGKMAEMEVTEAELLAEYEKRKASLEEPDKAVYEFVAIRRFDLQRDVVVSDAELRKSYEEVKAEKYGQAAQATIRHLLLTVPWNANEEEAAAIRRTAESLYRRAAEGTPLSLLADEFSEDPQNVRYVDELSTRTVKLGGLLPSPITREQKDAWGEEFIETVFSLPVDTISSPILTARGWDIFQVISRSEEGYQPFEQVRMDVERELKKDLVDKKFEEARYALEEARKNQTTLAGIARAVNSKVELTSPVLVGSDYIPRIGSVRDYQMDIKELTPGSEPTEVISTGQAYAVVAMKDFFARHIPSFETVRERLTTDLKARKALEAAISDARSVLRRVESGDTLTSIAAELNLRHEKGGEPMVLESPNHPYTEMRDFVAWVKRTPAGGAFLALGTQYGASPGMVYLCRVIEKTPPSREEFMEGRDEVEMGRIMARRQALMRGYLTDARKQLDPRFNPDYLSD
jgi:peptidyl-prolyl cis-trans isomerase D